MAVSYERRVTRQLLELNENCRCSTLFHLLVPGGKWLTWIATSSLSATRCSWCFQTCDHWLLLPPASAVMKISRVCG